MLLCGFESRLGLEFTGIFGYVAFSLARRQGFSPGTAVSSPPSSVNGFIQYNKAKINGISTLANLIAELSLRTKWHTAGCT